MKVFERVVNARERAASLNTTSGPRKVQSQIPTAVALTASNFGSAPTGVIAHTATRITHRHHAAMLLMFTQGRRFYVRLADVSYVSGKIISAENISPAGSVKGSITFPYAIVARLVKELPRSTTTQPIGRAFF